MIIACDTDAHDWVLSPSMAKLEEQIEQIEWKREEKGDTSTLQFLILFHIILFSSFVINKNNNRPQQASIISYKVYLYLYLI